MTMGRWCQAVVVCAAAWMMTATTASAQMRPDALGCYLMTFGAGIKSICIESDGVTARYNHNADFGVCSTVGTVAVSGTQLRFNFPRHESGCADNTPQNQMLYVCVFEGADRMRCEAEAYRSDGGVNTLPTELYEQVTQTTPSGPPPATGGK